MNGINKIYSLINETNKEKLCDSEKQLEFILQYILNNQPYIIPGPIRPNPQPMDNRIEELMKEIRRLKYIIEELMVIV